MTDKLHMTPELQIIFDDIIRDSSYSSRDLINIYQSDQNFAMFFKEIMLKNEQMKNNIINLRKQHSDMNESDFFRSVVVNHTKSIIEAIKKEYIGILSPEQIDRLNKFQLEITYDEKFEHDITAHSEKNIISINTAYFGKGKSIEEKIVLAMGTMPHELFHFVIQMLKQKEICDERMVYELSNGEMVKNLGMVGYILNEGFVEKISSDFCKRNGLFYSINPSYIQYVNLCNYIMRNNSQITEEFLIKNNYEGIFNNFAQDVLDRYKDVERTAYINNFSLKMADGTYRKIKPEEVVKSYNQRKIISNNDVQSYNYHTHTNRCGHAGIFSDREYVEFAKRNGIKQLGFSDHVPVPELEYQDDEQRMHLSDVEEYIKSIRTLQNENPDMKILCGFEAEFDPMKEQFLGELREKVDYMILGQHFVSNGIHKASQTNNPNYPIEYANMLCKAIESGIFDIVAHPDIFMQFRDSLETEEAKRLFDQNAMIASQAICDKAKEIGIPIELNFAGIDKNQVMKDGEFSYPHSIFWKIAEETGTQVLYGVDAHNPSQFDAMDYKKEVIDKIVNTSKLNFVSQNYNPVVARQNNKKLQELYEKGQAKSLTYETHLIDTLMGGILSNVSSEMEISMVTYGVEQTLDGISQNFSREATEKDQKTVSKIDGITQDTILSTQEKSFALNRAKKSLEHTNTTLSQRQSAIARAKESVHTAMEVGCQTKNELKTTVVELTEAKTTKKEEVKSTMENNVMRTQAINNGMSVSPQVKGPTLVKKNNTSNVNGQSSNNGFINAVTLALIVAFVCGIGVGIGYMLYKIGLGG